MKTEYVIGIAVVLIIAFLLVNQQPVVPPQNQTNNTTIVNAVNPEIINLYLGTFDKEISDSYDYKYYEKRGQFELYEEIIKSGNLALINVSSTIGKREIYFNDSQVIVCVTLNSRKCSYAENTSSMKSYIYSVGSLFLNESREKKSKEGYQIMIDKGAIKFDNKLTDKKVDGRDCKEISYIRDYSVLTGSDKAKLGITGGPQKYEETWCITGDEVIEKTVKTTVQGQEVTAYFKLVNANYNYNGKIEFPKTNYEGAESLLLSLVNKEQTFENCFMTRDSDSCFFELAIRQIDIGYCAAAGNKSGSCYMNFAIAQNNSAICENINDKGYYEDCYIEMAGFNKDPGFCGKVENTTKKQMCLNASNSS